MKTKSLKSFKELIVWQKAYGLVLEISQYLLSIDLNYIKQNVTIEILLKEIGGMLYRIMHPKRQEA